MSGSMPATRQLDWLISMTAMIVLGHGNAAVITAIGDAVNTASRLESLTKNFACELVVSEETVSRAGFDLSDFPLHEIEIRSKRKLLAVRSLASAAELPTAGAGPSEAPPQISSRQKRSTFAAIWLPLTPLREVYTGASGRLPRMPGTIGH
jgi:hypothetical protein